MNLPVLDFATLWRGMRCPRQLAALIQASPCFNPKTIGSEELRRASAFPPELLDAAGAESLDWFFNRDQEKQVAALADSLFPDATRIEAETLWGVEGESLRELGWLAAAPQSRHKALVVHKDNWFELLPRQTVIAGAGFLDHFLWVSPDYLVAEPDGSWLVLLVRPSVRVRDSYIAEAGFIKDVLARKGLKVSACYVLCPDEDYQAEPAPGGQAADPRRFFRLHSLNQSIKHQRQPLLDAVPGLLHAAQAGQACDQARSCPICSRELPPLGEHPVQTLHRGGKAVDLLEAQGIHDLRDIDRADAKAKAELKDRHHIQVKTIRENRPHVDRAGLSQFLKELQYPLFFLDFETTAQAIPPAPGLRSWEHVPFMFSAHRVEGPEALAGADPARAIIHLMSPTRPRGEQLSGLADALIDAAQGCRSVIVYGAGLESHVLARLGQLFPRHAARFQQLRDRIVDLQAPFQQFHYYHPKQYGKLSLKKVLPLLGLSTHSELELQSGGEANLSYYFMSNPQALPPGLRAGFDAPALPARLEALEAYCAMDTLGLVQILSALTRLAV